MSKIKKDQIASIFLHWSESSRVSDCFGVDDCDDINKMVDFDELNNLIVSDSKEMTSGYDKLSMTITLKSGLVWCEHSKFHVTKGDDLITVINKGQQHE